MTTPRAKAPASRLAALRAADARVCARRFGITKRERVSAILYGNDGTVAASIVSTTEEYARPMAAALLDWQEAL